jgi:hypothetical protein
MRATDQAKQARRLYLELRAAGAWIATRPAPDGSGKTQFRPEGLERLPAEQADALWERCKARKNEILSLMTEEPNDPDAWADVKAILEEGAA